MTMVPELTRADSLSRQAYDALRRAIRDGRIAPGGLFSESEMASQMGVSRTPVREALIELFREGLVEIVPKRGFRLVDLSDEDIFELRVLRSELEGMVVQRLCEIGDPEHVRQLRVALAAQAGLQGGGHPAIFDLDEDFHLLLARLAGLNRTGQTLMGVRGALYLLSGGLTIRSDRTAEVVAEHTAIVDAIEAGDVEPAREAMAGHVGNALDAVLEARQAAVDDR